jgi:DNA-binding transcriptional LysR family regulator
VIELADQTHIELDYLRCFVAVAEELHFRRAAARLGIPQSTLSNRIARVETEIGVQLIVRNRRRVALTRAGAVLYGGARQLLAEAGELLARTRAAGGAADSGLRLGHDATSTAVAVQVLTAVRRDHPGLTLSSRRLEPAAEPEALRAGTIDVAVVVPIRPADAEGLVVELLSPGIALAWRRGDTRPVVRLVLDTARHRLGLAADAGGGVIAPGAARPAPAVRPRQRSAP